MAGDDLLPKIQNIEKELELIEVEGELAYVFLLNCKNTERAGEGSKKEESSKDVKHECLKMNSLREVILIMDLQGVSRKNSGRLHM